MVTDERIEKYSKNMLAMMTFTQHQEHQAEDYGACAMNERE